MELVQEVIEEFLTILMVVPSELWIFLQYEQYILWLKFPSAGSIEMFDELPESTCHMPLTT